MSMLLVICEKSRVFAVGQESFWQETCRIMPIVPVHVRCQAGDKYPSLSTEDTFSVAHVYH